MLVMVGIVCIAVLLAAVQVKRIRNRKELEQHSISPEELHNLLVAKNDVALFDVRLPLDLLSNLAVIPGATRISPEEVIANPSLIPNDRDSVVYCTCPGEATSRAILNRARSLGIQRIKFLKGGLQAWKSKGFAVEPYDKPFHLGSGTNLAGIEP